jgi:hypothetical protein
MKQKAWVIGDDDLDDPCEMDRTLALAPNPTGVLSAAPPDTEKKVLWLHSACASLAGDSRTRPRLHADADSQTFHNDPSGASTASRGLGDV